VSTDKQDWSACCQRSYQEGISHPFYVVIINKTKLVKSLENSPGTPLSSINKTNCHDITEILLKVALNIINQTYIQYLFTTIK